MVRKSELPDELRRFVLTSIPSVPYLEALLLMRSEPSASWDASLVARRLYLGDRAAADILHALATAGITRTDDSGTYRYHPATAELGARLDALANAYAADLLGVTDLIHSRIDKRAQQFADAFRLRKDS